jgi:hypothetical protein
VYNYIFVVIAMNKKQIFKPRNPLIAPLLFKKSGAHRKSNKAVRRAETQKVRKECGL